MIDPETRRRTAPARAAALAFAALLLASLPLAAQTLAAERQRRSGRTAREAGSIARHPATVPAAERGSSGGGSSARCGPAAHGPSASDGGSEPHRQPPSPRQ